tara:strand:+ start:14 stop:520 length:507 start_codon:yes stop_codon:yes gene_type:complete
MKDSIIQFKTKLEYNRELKALLALKKYNIDFTVQYLKSYDQTNTIHIVYDRNIPSLDDILNTSVIPLAKRKMYWKQIQNMIRVLHMYNFSHGDFNSKNILVTKKDKLILCNFHLSIVDCKDPDIMKQDKKNALFIFYQLHCNEKNKKEQEFQNDLLNILSNNIMTLSI